MSYFQAFFLGIIQGIAEFLPISSSAHLRLLQYFFHLQPSPFFELTCHLGTACAAIIFLRKEIKKLFTIKPMYLGHLFFALFPLIPFYFLFSWVKAFLHPLYLIGIFFCCTSTFLFISVFLENKKTLSSKKKISDSLFIGCMQACAFFPGISRSGSTISAAIWRGWNIQEAISFSFLLAIPTILGGSIIESWNYLKSTSFSWNLSFFIGFLASFLMGFFTIRFLFSIKSTKKLLPFAWYCLGIGIITFFYFFPV